MSKPILVGAVVYDPKVVVIWDIIKDFFRDQSCPIDYVFYSNYELMVDALLSGHIQIAWNSPLAWVDAQRRTGNMCRAIAMRDTDRDRVTHLIVRRASGIEKIEDLRGGIVATGAQDSPQATLLPLHFLQKNGLQSERDFTVQHHDLMLGKHGDHVGGEMEALRSLSRGEAQACAVLDLNWATWQADGTADPNTLTSLATTKPFDHCNFTVLKSFPHDEEERWRGVLFQMRYDNPQHREMMDMEGLKEWLPGRTVGYTALAEAAEQQRFFGKKDL